MFYNISTLNLYITAQLSQSICAGCKDNLIHRETWMYRFI